MKKPPAKAAVAALGVLLAVPAFVLGTSGFVHFRDGVAVDAAIPVPVYMVAQVPLPKNAYIAAADALSQADPRNGHAAIAAAEASRHAGEQPGRLVPLLQQGLIHEPASARGWTLLSEVLYPVDRKKAAAALSQALILAPRDYWLIGARAKDAALLWSDLGPDAQVAALGQVQLLWQTKKLRGQMRELLRTPDGAALVTRAFGQDDIRAVNRWHSRKQRLRPMP